VQQLRCARVAGVAVFAGLAVLAVLALGAASARAESRAGAAQGSDGDRFDVVVLDAGHGGEDDGARGSGGLVEKDVALDVVQRLATRLRKDGLRVVMTRDRDVFVPLEERTSIANDARGDLFISIHANAARSASPRGIETYFVSLEASDAEARKVAELENQALGATPSALERADPLSAILGDMMSTLATEEASDFAKLAQRELDRVDSVHSRGVKQAPFVVLMGVQMPASLVEVGFLTNRDDEGALGTARRREALATALARAVDEFGRRYDARRGARAGVAAPD
jgi:N-acetylmuramoyl-L-alanine amidase